MHPKSAEEVFVRMPDSLSDAKMVNKAAIDCPDAPLGRHKVGETFPKSAGCTLEEQKRPKVLPKGFGASLKCIEPKKNISQLKRMDKIARQRILRILSVLPYHLSSNFRFYLSGNATLTVIAQDNGIEYEYNPQSGTPPDRPSVQSIKDERRSA